MTSERGEQQCSLFLLQLIGGDNLSTKDVIKTVNELVQPILDQYDFYLFCCLQKSGLLWVLWVMEGMWMAEGAGVQGQGPGWGGHAALRGMWPCLPRCWGGAACPRAAAVLLLMLAWLSAASFTLSYTRGIFFVGYCSSFSRWLIF